MLFLDLTLLPHQHKFEASFSVWKPVYSIFPGTGFGYFLFGALTLYLKKSNVLPRDDTNCAATDLDPVQGSVNTCHTNETF